MKKLLALMLCVILVAGLFGCGGNGAESETTTKAPDAGNTDTSTPDETTDAVSGEEVTLTVWAWDPSFNISIMNRAADIYMADHSNVKFEVMELAKADVEQKLHTTLASKTTEGLPDIVLIEDYNAQKYLTSYPGAFADVTDSFDFADFAAYKNEILSLDGKMYGIPFDSGVAGMFYRKDILEEAGYTADDLKNITWDEYIEIGKAVKEKTGKAMLGFEKSDGGLMRIMMQSAGQWYFDEQGNSIVSSSEVIKEAIETYKKIVDADIAKPTAGWDEWVGSVNSGEVATITTGVWIVGSVKGGVDQSGSWDVAPVPRLNNSASKNASNLGGSSWYVLNDTPNRDIAIDFMKTVYGSDSEFYQQILMNNGAIGSYLPAFEGDAYATPDEFFGDKAIYQDLSAWASEIPKVNYGSYTYEADSAVMAQMDAYVTGGISLEDMLAAAEAQLANQLQ